MQQSDKLVIGGVELSSRLFIGTGKYSDDALIPAVCEASAAEVITVAMRRVDKGGTGQSWGTFPAPCACSPETSRRAQRRRSRASRPTGPRRRLRRLDKD